MDDDKPLWQSYNEAQLTRAVRPLTTALLEHAGDGNGRHAIDLGCGSGVETRALVAAGWRVTAIDSDPSMPARLSDLVASSKVEAVVSDIRDAQLSPAALVHSSLTLPFVPVTDFGPVWERIRRSLVPGGWLAVDLFGTRDDWYGTPDLNVHPRAGVDQLVAGLDVLEVIEEERDGPAFRAATKHWHVFHVLARMPD